MAAPSRSGFIRSAIGPKKTRLYNNVTEANDLRVAVLPTDAAGAVRRLGQIDDLVTKINTGIGSLNVESDKWQDLLYQLDEQADIDAEQTLYNVAANDPSSGFQIIIDDAREARDLLQLHTKHLQRVAYPEPDPDPAAAVTDADAHNASSSSSRGGKSSSARLERISLPKFSGDPFEFCQMVGDVQSERRRG